MNACAPPRGLVRRFFTVGHSTRSAEELLALLREAKVPLVVDVRRFPASRRHPQFAREALSLALEKAGVAYRHEPDLGGRRQPLPASPNGAWRNDGFRGYADHMASSEFAAALERLLRSPQGTTVLCAEAVPWRCHRQLIADALVARGAEVRHILGPRRLERHALHESARVSPAGLVTYPPRGQAALFGGEPDH
jgi:uncharacterized protein (DUF488 family)